MAEFSIISHKDKQIYYVNANGATKEEVLLIMDKYEKAILKSAPKSALVLFNLLNCYVGIDVVTRFNQNAIEREKHAKKTALVGLRGLSKLAYNAYEAYVQAKGVDISSWFKKFDNIEKAKEWLIED